MSLTWGGRQCRWFMAGSAGVAGSAGCPGAAVPGVGASKASGRQCRASGAGSAGVLRPAVPGKLGRQCRGALGGSAGLMVAAVPALGCLLRWRRSFFFSISLGR